MTTLSAIWQSICGLPWAFLAGVYLGFCAGAVLVFLWWAASDMRKGAPRWDEREGQR